MISSSDILHSKILIVDDQEAKVILLERMLHGVGYDSVSSTIYPSDVCELHRKNRYDLILLDLLMPDMDGFEVMEGLKKIEPDAPLPVIVITAHPDHKLHAFQAGARDFISKPFELADVLARVHNMLEVRLLYVETKNHIKALEQKVREVEASLDLIRRQSGGGERFSDKVVFMQDDATPLPQVQVSQAQVSQAAHLHTLLYVEDNPANLKLVEQIIARHPDMRLLPAVTGNKGIEIARASRPDVILMDINLPDFTGFETLKILQSDPATVHIPVIAISGNAMPRDIQRGLEAGFVRYLTKPIKVEELMEALYVALESAGKYSAKSK
jgi:adenylate cyclase